MKSIEDGYVYELDEMENTETKQTLKFVNKSNPGNEHDGVTMEEVLKVLIDRMKFLQKKFACRENAIVITKLEEALLWLNYRTQTRKEQGVLGKNLPHNS